MTPRRRAVTSRRRTELGLLILGGMVVGFAYVLASLGKTASIPADIGPFLGVIYGLALVAHVANRWLVPDATPVILPVAALLNGIGYVVIARLNYKLAGLQAVWTGLGVAVYVLTLVVIRHSRDLARYRYLVAFAGLALLLLPLAPKLGQNINGARLWVRLGPVTFQPVELAKIALIIFFASYFVEKRELLTLPTVRVGNRLITDPRPFGPVVLAWGFSLLVMTAERDVGFSLLIFVLFVSMLWMATGRLTYLVVGAVLFVIGAFVAAHLFGHVHDRITVWLDPWKYANGIGYQVVQSQYAFGSGGLAGSGLGLGHPTLIPVASSDFIFAAIGEEMGLLGTVGIIMAFLVLVGTALRTALGAKSDFPKLLAAGITAAIGFQAFFIMAGVVRLLPLTGVTLPFVAYGGSSLLANYVLIALLMRVSDENVEQAVPPQAENRVAIAVG
ncbi:MAG TPA: FtsW/RodA/SpoVE family cell cycle protein [Acidimicrobiales bacterium]|nr:FtsW/RodA/SpoVE family cell cycle protein [Acidimicrobiales bacterium]